MRHWLTGRSSDLAMSDVGPATWQAAVKRLVDVVGASIGLVVTGLVIAAAIVVSRLETGDSGVYTQLRIGRDGATFPLLKIRTMRSAFPATTTVTVSGDDRITRVGAILRRFKIDELPQFVNVLVGDMSLVGPRPDVQGYADRLTGADRLILIVRPGITGPAALAYRNEEELLNSAEDPQHLNDTVVWPDKVRLNVEYVQNYSLRADLAYLLRTVTAIPPCGVPVRADANQHVSKRSA